MSTRLIFTGKVVAETKVKNSEGMAVRLTTDKGVFIEVTRIEDLQLFRSLCKLVELDTSLKIIIEKE